MKKVIAYLLIFVVVISCGVSGFETRSHASSYVKNEQSCIVQFKKSVNEKQKKNFLAAYKCTFIGNDKMDVYAVSGVTEKEIKKRYSDIFKTVEVDNVQHVAMIPNDTYFESNQNNLNLINMPEAWDYTLGLSTVKIGVIDTGVIRTLPNLKNTNIAPGYDFIKMQSGVDGDGFGHGTVVIQTIAAGINDGYGTSGICNNVEIYPYCVSNNGTMTESKLIAALNKAIEDKCDIVNMSLGGSGYSKIYEQTVKNAISHGIILVAAVGNEGTSVYMYPAAFKNVLGVGYCKVNGEVSVNSEKNSSVFCTTVGEGIIAQVDNERYKTFQGSSFASPQVAGIAALVKSVRPKTSRVELMEAIAMLATDKGTVGRDYEYGYGMINAGKVVSYFYNLNMQENGYPNLVQGSPTPTPVPTLTPIREVIEEGSEVGSVKNVSKTILAIKKKQTIKFNVSWNNVLNNVKVRIVNSKGKTVKTLYFNQELLLGSKSLSWNGKNAKNKYVAKGTYHIYLTVDSKIYKKKIKVV